MILAKIKFIILCWLFFNTASFAMILEKNFQKPKASTVRKYLKEINLLEISYQITKEDQDQALMPLVQSLFNQVKELDILNKFEPFLQDKPPKKNALIQNKLNDLIYEMTGFVRLYFTLFTALETCRAENTMFNSSSKIDFEFRMNHPDSFISFEDFQTAYETSDLHDRFLPFQYVSNFFCNLLSVYGLLDKSKEFGSIKTDTKITIGFIKDSGGYVLFPMYNEFSERSLLPYGEAYDQKRRIVVHTKGIIEKSQGIIALHTGDVTRPLQLGLYSGFSLGLPFIDSDLHFYYNNNALGNPDLIPGNRHKTLAKALFPEININELDQTRCKFFPMPTTPLEQKLVDFLVLEEQLNNGDKDSIKFLELALEYGDGDEKTLELYRGTLESELLELAEQELKVELEELVKQNNYYNSQPKNNKKTKNQSPVSNLRTRAEKKVEMLKVEGRQKWRHVLRLVNEIKKEFPNLNMANLNIVGSHITFHVPNSPCITIVPKHGKKDLSVDAGRVNCFVSKLINFAMSSESSNNK